MSLNIFMDVDGTLLNSKEGLIHALIEPCKHGRI